MNELRDLGLQVSEVIGATGIPVTVHPDPLTTPTRAPGMHIYLDPTTGSTVYLRWECAESLRSRASAASSAGNYDTLDVKLEFTAASAMAEAISRILTAAGYETGIGVDMAAEDVWVRRVH